MDVLISGMVDISGIEEATNAKTGMIQPITLEQAQQFSWQEIRVFLHHYALYTLPTVELIDYLANIIKGKTAIEIGCGLGVIGRTLGIPITDNKMQEWPDVKKHYEAFRQPTIKYPSDVEELDALAAVEKYKPDVVIGSYITHKWDDRTMSGNWWGVDTLQLIKNVPEYYMIGNLLTHKNDPAMEFCDGVEHHDFLITRGEKASSVIFRWK